MFNRKKSLTILLSLIFVLGIFTGCGNNSETTKNTTSSDKTELAESVANEETKSEEDVSKDTEPSQESEEESSDELKTVTLAYNPGLGNVLGFIAKEKGYDKEEGINFDFVEFTNTTDALTALRSGKIDFGVSWGTSAPLVLINQGADFAIIGGHENGGMPVYAKQDFEYEGLESFIGKKVATARMYTPDIVWRAAMQTAGYDLDKDVEIMEFKKPSEALEAVKSDKADIFVGTNSTYPAAMESGLKIIANSSDFWNPPHVGCRVVVNNSWLEENEDIAIGFLKAYIKAEKVVQEDPEFAVKVHQESTGVDEEYARAQVLETKQIFQTDPLTDGIIYNYERLLGLDYITEDNIDFPKHLKVKYYKEAMEQLIKENPDDEFYKNLEEVFLQNNSKMLEVQ